MTKVKIQLSRLPFYLVVALILFYICFPIYWMLLTSFKSPNLLFRVDYWPRDFTLINYRYLTFNQELLYGLYNSIMISSAVLLLSLALGSIAAFALGRLKFRGRNLIRFSLIGLAGFPHISIMGGLYLLVTNPCILYGGSCPQYQLYNTRLALIITYLLLTLPLTIWFLTSFYRELPAELEDAAYVDGASPLQTFYYVLLPVSTPALVTTGLLAFITAWNEFLFALTFTIDESSRTAPVALSRYSVFGSATSLGIAGTVLVSVPAVLLAVTFRRQLTSGLAGLISVRLTTEEDWPGWWSHRWQKWGLPAFNLTGPEKIYLFLLGLGLLSFLWYSGSVIRFPYPVDYGEGPLLDQARRLADFQNIYQTDLSRPPYTITNYPPLYVLLQVPFVWLFGPAYWYGRLISWGSMLLASAALTLLLYRFSRDRLAALSGGLLLLTIPYASVWAPLARIDALALGLSLTGLAVLVGWPERRWSLPVGALLLTAAVYSRQSYGLAAPLAAFVWLLSRPPRYRAFILAGLMATVGLGLFAWLNYTTAGGFFFNIITANINEFQPDLLNDYLEDVSLRLPGLLLLGAFFGLAGGWFRRPGWWLVTPYLIGAALSALTIGKIGSNVNYLIELSAALSLVAGLMIAWLHQRSLLYTGLILLLSLQIFLLLPGSINHLFIESKISQTAEQMRLETIVAQANGPVLADEDMGLLPLLGRPIYLQPFEVTQLASAGVWEQQPLLEAIARREFPVILILRIGGQDLAEERWTPQMLAAIEQNYHPAERVGDEFSYVQVYRPQLQN